jgi:hypothetical protein
VFNIKTAKSSNVGRKQMRGASRNVFQIMGEIIGGSEGRKE